jgi:predicted SprT family Zn-dependent metalloprotease
MMKKFLYISLLYVLSMLGNKVYAFTYDLGGTIPEVYISVNGGGNDHNNPIIIFFPPPPHDDYELPLEEDPGDGNVGIGVINDPTTTVPDPVVANNLTDPCLKTILNNIIFGSENNTFTKILQGFALNQDSKLTFTQYADYSQSGIQTDGTARAVNEYSQIINLNYAALDNASNEYVAATIYHEIIHVTLQLQGISNSDQHDVMAQEWRDDISNQLQADFPNLTKEDADALAWGGLGETEAFQAMIEKDTRNNTGITGAIAEVNRVC